MINFKEAVNVATENAKGLLPDMRNLTLEGVMISENGKNYEVSLSFNLNSDDPYQTREQDELFGGGLAQLATVMGQRRLYKTFFVDKKSGVFKGFKNGSDI